MRKILFGCFLLLFGCSSDEPIPDHIYPVEKMTEILRDIHIVDQALVEARITIDTATALYHNHYLPIICKRYDVTKSGIDSSLKYYVEHVENKKGFQKIYEIVVDSLTLLEIRK